MIAGYASKFLSVDLSRKTCSQESIDENTLKKWFGGTGLGAMIISSVLVLDGMIQRMS
jgi:aldehyde:ferredoxin oxidoreductase